MLVCARLQKGNDVLPGAIGPGPVDGTGICLGDRHLSVLDDGSGGIGYGPGDRSAKLLTVGSHRKQQRGKQGTNDQQSDGTEMASGEGGCLRGGHRF